MNLLIDYPAEGNLNQRSASLYFDQQELSSEQEILLCFTGSRVTDSIIKQTYALFQSNINWSYLYELALEHGVLPLLSWNIKTYCKGFVPVAVYERFSRFYFSNCYRNLMLSKELTMLIDYLDQAGVPSLPYKGPTLAVSAYGDLSFRQFGDLDILVREGDTIKARDLLISLGYKEKYGFIQSRERLFVFSNHSFNLMHPESKIVVEIHWRIVPRYFYFQLTTELLLSRSQQIDFHGKKLPVLLPEDLLITLCVHGSKHCWSRLSYICDVAELIAAVPKLDFDWVLQEAIRIGARRMLVFGVALAHEVLALKVPDSFHAMSRDDFMISPLTRYVCQQLFAAESSSDNQYKKIRFHLNARERMRERILYILHFLFTPTYQELSFIRFSDWLSFLYVPLRPIRLLLIEPMLRLLPARVKTVVKQALHSAR